MQLIKFEYELFLTSFFSNLNLKEQENKKGIEKMIEHNHQMKIQFENYDELKKRFYSEIIQDLECNNEKELDG